MYLYKNLCRSDNKQVTTDEYKNMFIYCSSCIKMVKKIKTVKDNKKKLKVKLFCVYFFFLSYLEGIDIFS